MTFDVHFLELPGQALALAVAGFVFEQEDVVLGGEDARTAVVVGVLRFAIHRQDRHDRGLRVRREKGADVKHGAERDVAQAPGAP